VSRAMSRVRVAEPPRLASRDDAGGRLLREAERAFQARLSPEIAWKRFQARRQRRWFVRFAVVAAFVLAGVAFARQRLTTPVPVEAPTLVAERLVAPTVSAAPSASVVTERRISPPAAAPARPRAPSVSSPSSSSPSLSSPALHNSVVGSSEPVTDATCRAWAGQGRAERAVDCYQEIARQSGIGAEVALYEAARLSSEALGDAPRALGLLEQHSSRFPNSVLRVEVHWLQIRSLERAGKLEQALTESEALLDSAEGRSLAPQLHLLRGRIYADARQDCARALPEFVALLGEPGVAGDEAEFSRARCLERLHKVEEAREAYQRYLGRADARSANAAQARLNAVSEIRASDPAQPPPVPAQALGGQH